MKKIRPYLWRGGALVLAAALVVLLVLSGMGLSTQEPEPLPQPPAQTIRTEGQGGASQQENPIELMRAPQGTFLLHFMRLRVLRWVGYVAGGGFQDKRLLWCCSAQKTKTTLKMPDVRTMLAA